MEKLDASKRGDVDGKAHQEVLAKRKAELKNAKGARQALEVCFFSFEKLYFSPKYWVSHLRMRVDFYHLAARGKADLNLQLNSHFGVREVELLNVHQVHLPS